MKDPRISIIIPTYNRDNLILKALESIFIQTFQDFEILIIDDASTDKTEQVIKELNHSKVRYFKLENNSGQCIARNFGVKRAKGEFVAFLDSDDEWLPEKIEKQVALFETGSDRLGGVYGNSYTTDAIKNTTTLAVVENRRGDIHNEFMRGFCPPTPSMFMVKREAIEKVNGFDEALITFVDLDLWIRISEHYYFDFVEDPVIIKYEQIGDQYVNNFEKRYRGFHLFMEKWSREVKLETGSKGLLDLRQHLTKALVVPLVEHPPDGIHWKSIKMILLLVKARSVSFRLYLKAWMILLFGPRVIYRIRAIIRKKE